MNAPIDVRLLAVFVEVVDGGGFSAAANALGSNRATVSRNIATLEDLVGSRLFHRTTRRVSLTSAGTALYARTAVHLRALAQAARHVPETQAEPAGILKITAPYDLGATFLGSALARFTTLYPKIQVQAEFSSRTVDLGAEGFDVAIRGSAAKVKDTSLTVRKLVQRGELGLYASPGYLARKGTPRGYESANHDWLIAHPLRRAFDFPASVTPRLIANDFLCLRGVAVAGGGIAMLPSFMADPFVTTGALTRVLSTVRVNAGGLALVYSSTRPLARKVSAFRDFMTDIVEKEWVG